MSTVIEDLLKYKTRIESKKHAVVPDIHWNGERRKVDFRK